MGAFTGAMWPSFLVEMRAIGPAPPRPPQVGASRKETLRGLWTGACLEAVETREISVARTFADFGDFWMTNVKSPTLGPMLAAMASGDVQTPGHMRSRVAGRSN
jgi:hypothetical protein